MKRRLFLIICAALLVAGCTTTQRASRYSNSAPCATVCDDVYPGTVTIAAALPAVPQVNFTKSTLSSAAQYTVRPGDTLWSISKAYNVDLDTLAKINNITDNSAIEKGQVLIIPTAPRRQSHLFIYPASYAAARNNAFVWPVRGPILSRFGEKIDKGVNKGVDIKASEGANVVASRSGRVVYRDEQLKGFGMTVIIDHGDSLETVYSYNSDILVNVGDTVAQGHTIAKVGQSGRATEPMLHFEIRRNGEPEDPARYLR